MYFPSSEKELIASVIASLKKRHKALKHKVKVVTCDKVLEARDGAREEKLEVSLQEYSSNLRAHVWEDRWVWVDFRSPGRGTPGWRWEWTYDGRLLSAHDGRALVEALEQTLDASASVEVVGVSVFSAIWKPLLAQGPKLIG